ncbi:FAD/FMN-containing dehydrogenase [Sphingomonas laterariae]|uniref:FAD/FMN-containing dehydrogenase n=1 Tax=Edaphosphingomonas laterariae TaxID=861865 RepID=A0A239CAX5_9SPHN|nr:FAD-binding oxidoreductase [Sphingomonas laterariae]SNS17240.1 FAD/FMN-containing dehydrogenase [Sphingomonas laterariae]
MAASAPDPALLARLLERLGPRGFTADPRDIEPWIVDWRGRVRGKAVALLSPADAGEVADVVAMCAAAGLPIVPQGGNTSMVAGATPPADGSALVLSTRRMRAIRAISVADGVAVVDAGVVLADLHAAAAAQGLRFPLSLGAKGSATIGGLISTNAGGTQVLRFGPMRSLVLGIEAVLPDGSRIEGLSALRKDNRGYDLRQLMSGAEGTLGIITAASLRLVPAIGRRAVAWVGLSSPQAALGLLRRLEAATGEAVESFELVPGDALELVLKHIPDTRAPLTGGHAWHVLVEATAPQGAADPADALGVVLADAIEAGEAADAAIAASEAQAEALWRLRESISEAERIDGMAAKHDVSVPVSTMPAFIQSARVEVEAAFPGTRVLAFGHLGDGNVHFNVRAPAGVDGMAWLAGEGASISRMVHDLTVAADGSISAEHGIGQTKLAEYLRLADPARLRAQRAIKAALDPQGIMNPGKLLG